MNILRTLTGLGEDSKFKQMCTPQERWKKHLNIVKSNPNHTSIIIEKMPNSKIVFQKPYLIYGLEKSCTVHELLQNVRGLLALEAKDNLVLLCNGMIPNPNDKIKSLERFTQPDGFIYFYVSEVQTYG